MDPVKVRTEAMKAGFVRPGGGTTLTIDSMASVMERFCREKPDTCRKRIRRAVNGETSLTSKKVFCDVAKTLKLGLRGRTTKVSNEELMRMVRALVKDGSCSAAPSEAPETPETPETEDADSKATVVVRTEVVLEIQVGDTVFAKDTARN